MALSKYQSLLLFDSLNIMTSFHSNYASDKGIGRIMWSTFCIVKAKLIGGVEMMATASHVTQSLHNPEIEIMFDKGKISSVNSVWYVEQCGKSTCIGTAHHESQQKIWDMVRFVRDDKHSIICSVETAMAHTRLIELLKKQEASTFMKHSIENEELIYIDGLDDILKKGYQEYSMNTDALDALCGV